MQNMNGHSIGFIGYGNMAKAIAASFSGADGITSLGAYDVNVKAADGNAVMYDSAEKLIAASDIVFLSVKPQSAPDALAELDFSEKIVISIMAGTDIAKIASLCCGATKIVRVMPNLCARVGKSVSAFCPSGLSEDEKQTVFELLSRFGLAAEFDESYFDVITGLTGSSPAYTFRYARALTECGVRNGMTFEQARDLSLYCIAGCMDVLASSSSLEEMQTMIDNVCSKGGTTIEGIYVLNEGNFDNLVMNAVDAAIARSRELSGKK